MRVVGTVHLAAALTAIVSGAAVLIVSPKGARRHRQLGWVWVASMLLTNATALGIYGLFGGFGPFHYAAVVSLLGIAAGVVSARRARRRRLARDAAKRGDAVAFHYFWMTWSYIGLVAALVSEVATRHPATRDAITGTGIRFGLAVGLSTAAVVAIGGVLVFRRAKAVLAPFAPREAGARTT